MKKTIWLSVPVEVPEDFDDSIDLAGFLNDFINIGLDDLTDSVEDDEVESSEEEEFVVNQTEWGQPRLEVKF